MLNLNGKQILGIVGAIISVLMVSSAQLTDLLGATQAKYIVTIAGLLNLMFQSISVALSTQTAQVKDVLAMPGIEKLTVNSQASPALATIAVDPTVNKISPTQAAQTAVEATAKGSA